MIKIDDLLPDFSLKDQNSNSISRRHLKNNKILLSFHPLAWTKVCAQQMQGLESNFDELAKLNTIAFGLSIDSVPSKKAWAIDLGIEKTSLLSDFWPHGGLARQLGIFREQDGFSERANIIADASGKVIFTRIYEIKTLPDMNEIRLFLERFIKEEK